VVLQPQPLEDVLCVSHERLELSIDVSAVVTFTSSTFENWCMRMKPRVSFPAAPASVRQRWRISDVLQSRRSPSRISSR